VSLGPKTFAEALQKEELRRAKRSAKGKPRRSQAAKAGAARSREKQEETDKREEEWRLAVCERYDYTCQFPGCGLRHKSIHAHHIAPRSRRVDLKYVIENGICLCSEHHDWVHDHPVQATAMGLLSDESYELAHKRKEPTYVITATDSRDEVVDGDDSRRARYRRG